MGEVDLGRLLLEAHRSLAAELSEALAERGYPDVRPGHAALFMHIDRRSGTRLTELARRAHVTKQAMMLLVDELEGQGYVRRVPDPTDARAKLVRLTAKGRRYVAEARRAMAAVEAKVRRRLGRRRLEGLRGSLFVLLGDEEVEPVKGQLAVLLPQPEIDYVTLYGSLYMMPRRDGIVLKQIQFPVPPPSQDDLARRIEAAITPRTRFIHICHITNLTGQIFPVKTICQLGRARGIEVIVDGAHAYAHFPFTRDQLDCVYYGTSLHKWLTAPIGTGFLYVRRSKIGKVWPLMAAPPELNDNIRKFEEIGTHPAANYLAIAEALTFHQGIGPRRKEARLVALRDRWAKRLLESDRVRLHTSLKPGLSFGIATVHVDGLETAKLNAWLLKAIEALVIRHRHQVVVAGHEAHAVTHRCEHLPGGEGPDALQVEVGGRDPVGGRRPPAVTLGAVADGAVDCETLLPPGQEGRGHRHRDRGQGGAVGAPAGGQFLNALGHILFL